MSFQAMSWAVEKKLPALQKLVLLMLANHSNGHTGRCDPSHDRLAKECGMSITALKSAVKNLEQIGLLKIVPNKIGSVNLPNQYELQLTINKGGRASDDPGVSDSDQGGVTQGGRASDDPGVGRQTPTKQEYKPGSKTNPPLPPKGGLVSKPSLKPPPEIPDWLDAEVWESFVAFRKGKKAAPSDLAITLMFKNLDKLRKGGHDPVEVIEQSIMNNWTGVFPIKNFENGKTEVKDYNVWVPASER